MMVDVKVKKLSELLNTHPVNIPHHPFTRWKQWLNNIINKFGDLKVIDCEYQSWTTGQAPYNFFYRYKLTIKVQGTVDFDDSYSSKTYCEASGNTIVLSGAW